MNPASGSTSGGIHSGVFETSRSASDIPRQTCDAAIETSPVSDAKKAKTNAKWLSRSSDEPTAVGITTCMGSSQYGKFKCAGTI